MSKAHSSPVVAITDLEPEMDFPNAMGEVKKKNSITRVAWGNEKIICKLRNTTLQINLEDGWHTWIINEGDMFAEDWIVVND